MNNAKQPLNGMIPTVLGVAIFAWSALFVWQGLDFTDLGYSLVSYQQFYSAPQTNAGFLVNWLTPFIGYWMGEPLGGTVVVYKLGASAIYALTGILAYTGLRAIFGRSWAPAVFVFIAFLFASKTGGTGISYNNLTAFFYVLGGVLLFSGLVRERRSWVLIAGAVLGANLFIRFPNLLGIGLVVVIALYAWLERWSWRKGLQWSASYLLGCALGIAAVALLVIAHGHEDYYREGLHSIFAMAADGSSHHSGNLLIKGFVRDHLYALVLAFLVVIAGTLILRFTVGRPQSVKTAVILFSALILAGAFSVMESWKWAVPGLLYIGLLWIVWQSWRTQPHLVLLALIALTILVIAPLGSGNGMRNAVYGQWLALPLVMNWLWQQGSVERSGLPFIQSPQAARLAAIILATALVGLSLVTSWFYTYRDSTERLTLTHPIAHPLLRGTHTTEARARVVSELLAQLPNWVQPGDALLAYPDLPTLHFLTNTTAWLENPWPMLLREAEVQRRLGQKMQQSAALPVVVRSIGVTRNFTWPIDSPRDESPDREATWQVFDRFVDEHHYRRVWSNDFFEILVPR